MLSQFSFSNFKSYRSDTTFDFQAEAIPEFSQSLIRQDKASDLLPVSVVYGPNGGGKTNVLQAFACLATTVVRPIVELQKTRINWIIQQGDEAQPFLLDAESREKPVEFEVYFRVQENEYRYYIAIKDQEIISEHLYWKTLGAKKTGTVFVREGTEIELGASVKKSSINREVNPKMPYLSFLAINYNIPVITEVQAWFESCIILNYADPQTDHKIYITDDAEAKKRIIEALNDLGIDISDIRYDKTEQRLYTERIIDGKTYTLQFECESEGTKKLLVVLPVILSALHEGRVIVIDELDAKLHPKLLKYLVQLFKNPAINKNGAQLLFTSHDLTIMKNTVFRRDEIWFAALNGNHESQIYSLYDIRNTDNTHINNTAAYDKQYLEGRYGADPYLQNMLDGGVWS